MVWQKEDEILSMQQLAEKQKAKYTYGILEKQFNMFKKASAKSGITGEIFYNFVNKD